LKSLDEHAAEKLLRHFQPDSAEDYVSQYKDWESQYFKTEELKKDFVST
jgi:hypothetical protein